MLQHIYIFFNIIKKKLRQCSSYELASPLFYWNINNILLRGGIFT
jgi:hypothetical protein